METVLLKAQEKILYFFGNRFNFKPPQHLLVWVFLFAIPFLAKAQHTLKNFNHSSDYKVTFRFEGFHTDRCLCEETRSLKGYSDGFRSGTTLFTANNLGTEGDLEMVLGPGYGKNFYWTAHYDGITHNNGCTCTPAAGLCPKVTCHEYTDFNTGSYPRYIYTQAIKSPVNFTATNGDYDNKIILNWAKGSDIPNDKLEYKIYRDDVLIATIDPDNSALTYTDSNRQPGETHTYKVATFTDDWGNQESAKASATGATFSVGTVASTGEFHNRVKLTWNNVSSRGVDEIKIERSVPGGNKEELAIVNKNATTYSDYDGIPGYNYTYTVTPLAEGKTFASASSTGYRAPNGVLKGTIKSKLNAGVPGITVTVTVKTTSLTAGASNFGASSTYTAITDSAGTYEVSGIYYYKGAEFYITPTKTNHVFTPSKLTKKLDLNSYTLAGVDFTDETVFTVAGKIAFPAPNNSCVIKGVDILLNGKLTGVKTDNQGRYALAIQEEGRYTITPKYLHHVFDDPNTSGSNPSRTISVNGDELNQDFTDMQTDTLYVKVKGGCDNSIANFASVRISSVNPANCYNQTFDTNASGIFFKVLPAQAYNVEVVSINPANSNIINAFDPTVIDLSVRDTLTTEVEGDTVYTIIPAKTITFSDGRTENIPADTTGYTVQKTTTRTVVKPEAAFIYRGALTVKIHNLPDPVCTNTILMERGEKRMIRIEVLETHGNVTCPVDSGTVAVYDKVGDKGVTRYPIVNGEVFYPLTVGEPNIAATGPLAFKKLFEVFAEVGNRTKAEARQIVVTGVKPGTATYTSRTPELPFMVLHDPPGDASYSFLAKDSTITTSYGNQIGVGGEAGGFLNLKVGAGTTLPFIGKLGSNLLVNFAASAGRDNLTTDTYTSTFTATEQFSTSGGENFVGNQGDVIIGASMNVIYTLAKEVIWNASTCSLSVKSSVIWDPTDFATTYVYTEKHIEHTLLPQLNKLYDISVANHDTAQLVPLNSAISVWNQVLQKNAANRNKAKFVENKSFSAGAAIDNSTTSAEDDVDSFEYTAFVDMDLLLGLEVKGGDYNETSYGVVAKFRWNKTETYDTTRTKSTTIGYHLEDDDTGDFFSVDIGKDPVYSTPTFKIKAGTSSCPHEDNTQARYTPQIALTNSSVSNVPADQSAKFTALLTNLSESGEARQYDITVVSATNPDGAIVTLGGQQINQDPVSYYIPAGATIPVTLTVDRGPFSSTYQDIQIMMYPACEYDLWLAGGKMHDADTVTFSAYFQSDCSQISLREPGDNWLVKQSSNNKLHVVFTNYDASTDKLESVQLEYREASGDWQTAVTIPKAQLVDQFYDYFFDVSGLEDGKYEIRAKAVCRGGAGFTYSSVFSGIIDRSTVAPFGSATPADGFLRPGQKISVMFDKNLKTLTSYSTEKIIVTRVADGDTLVVPTTAAIINNQELVIKTNPESLISSATLRGAELTARVSGVQDANGNVQKYPIEWSFRVEKPVFWDPDTLIASVMIGSSNKIASDLKNATDTNKRFTITKYPAWLTPSALKGIILPTGFYKVEFNTSAELKPGVYKDVIEAEIDGVKEVMPVTLELLAIPVAWRVNPANYNYSMNMVVQYTLSNPPSNTPTSTDERDVIAAFINGVPRGVAKIRKIDGMPGKYAAFLTVYSNDASGTEKVNFRMWNALTGVEYGAVEKPSFVADAITGTAAAPYILHPEGTFQVIPLKKGWNWVSLNVSTTDMSREKVFSSLLSSGNKLTIKSQTDFTDFNPVAGWSGTLKTVNLTSGYMVYLSDKPDTLRVVGNTPATFSPVTLAGSWNWIGYPRLKNASIKTALGNAFVAKNGDLLKSFTSFATFTTPPTPGIWIGDLKTMDPGQSYKLKLMSPASLSYARKAKDGSGFEVDEHGYEYSMTLTGVLNLNGMPAHDAHYTIGAFINGKCRGFAQLEYQPNLKANRLFLTVYGDAADTGEVIEFKVFNAKTNEFYDGGSKVLAFVTDKIVGEALIPYVLNYNSEHLENGYYLSQNKPNPFSVTTAIDFTIPEDGPVEIVLYNSLGAQVKKLVNEQKKAGNYSVALDATNLASGVYTYTLKSGSYAKTRKLVIVHK